MGGISSSSHPTANGGRVPCPSFASLNAARRTPADRFSSRVCSRLALPPLLLALSFPCRLRIPSPRALSTPRAFVLHASVAERSAGGAQTVLACAFDTVSSPKHAIRNARSRNHARREARWPRREARDARREARGSRREALACERSMRGRTVKDYIRAELSRVFSTHAWIQPKKP